MTSLTSISYPFLSAKDIPSLWIGRSAGALLVSGLAMMIIGCIAFNGAGINSLKQPDSLTLIVIGAGASFLCIIAISVWYFRDYRPFQKEYGPEGLYQKYHSRFSGVKAKAEPLSILEVQTVGLKEKVRGALLKWRNESVQKQKEMRKKRSQLENASKETLKEIDQEILRLIDCEYCCKLAWDCVKRNIASPRGNIRITIALDSRNVIESVCISAPSPFLDRKNAREIHYLVSNPQNIESEFLACSPKTISGAGSSLIVETIFFMIKYSFQNLPSLQIDLQAFSSSKQWYIKGLHFRALDSQPSTLRLEDSENVLSVLRNLGGRTPLPVRIG